MKYSFSSFLQSSPTTNIFKERPADILLRGQLSVLETWALVLPLLRISYVSPGKSVPPCSLFRK